MSDDNTLSYQMTKPAPVVWARVIKARPERKLKSGEVIAPGYEATFLLAEDHPDLPEIKKLLVRAAAAHDKTAARMAENKSAGRSPVDGIKLPLENGTKIADEGKKADKDRDFMRGMAVFKASSKEKKRDGGLLVPPRLVVLQDGKYIRFREDHERPLAAKFFYSGVLAVGTFAFNAWSSGMGMGVTAYLNEILSLNAGAKINTGVDDEAKYGNPDQFKSYVGRVTTEDPTAGMEEIAF